VTLLKDGDLIVIDAGNMDGGDVTCDFIKDHLDSEKRIRALVVTHNHEDHSMGADLVLQRYATKIDCVYFPHDVPKENLRIYTILRNLEEDKRLKIRRARLEANYPGFYKIYPEEGYLAKLPSESEESVSMTILAPSYNDSIDTDETSERERPNRISGILLMQCGASNQCDRVPA
jgi:metal-dependent hydrolase (beta-lactamase superfamily II)